MNHHVSAVLAKLGVHSRTEAARAAPRLGTATATCAPGAAAPATQTGGPLTVTLARNVTATGEPLEPGTTFPPTTGRIYAAFKASGVGRGAVLKSVWTAVSVSSSDALNKKLGEYTETLEGDDAGAFYAGRASEPWPIGDYKVEFFINDQLVLTVPFRIAP